MICISKNHCKTIHSNKSNKNCVWKSILCISLKNPDTLFFIIIYFIIYLLLILYILKLLTPQCFQIPLTLRMFPVWEGILARKALLNIDRVHSTFSC